MPQAVASFPVDESAYGVRGMVGNVRDWCEERFAQEGPLLGAGQVVILSQEAPGPQGVEQRAARVNRGGCWGNVPGDARAAYRNRSMPNSRDTYLGLRLARTYTEA
jgi:serine/threonine-protein kinase